MPVMCRERMLWGVKFRLILVDKCTIGEKNHEPRSHSLKQRLHIFLFSERYLSRSCYFIYRGAMEQNKITFEFELD